MTNVQVRPAQPVDVRAWVAMREALWPEEGVPTHEREVRDYFAGRLHMPLEVLLAVDESGAPVGFAELSIRPYAEGGVTDRVAYLEGWYVTPERRRQGIGSALVAAAEVWATDQGCTEFGSDCLIDNDGSAAAHQALGFQETARIRTFLKRVHGPTEPGEGRSLSFLTWARNFTVVLPRFCHDPSHRRARTRRNGASAQPVRE